MKKNRITNFVFVLLFVSLVSSCKKDNSINNASDKNNKFDQTNQSVLKNSAQIIATTVFAPGIAFPRGLKFGPDGYLYVAVAGFGGTYSTAGQCTQVIPPIGPYLGGNTGKIVKISSKGVVSTVVDNLPSQVNAMGFTSGVAAVEFIGNTLYALIDAGCSHGNPDYPSSVIRINKNGTWSVIADLSAFYHTHPVAAPEEDDFEPDGDSYSMINVKGDLYVIEANHGQMLKVTTNGKVSRVLDFSAKYGHIVPTAIAYNDNFFVGNLGTFPLVEGSSNIYKVTPSGESKIWATAFTGILGIAFDAEDQMYVLETSQGPGPTPMTGRVVRIDEKMNRDIIVDNLFFPTGMTFGPDGNLYISNTGFGPPTGSILKVTGISSGHHDHDHDNHDNDHDHHHDDHN